MKKIMKIAAFVLVLVLGSSMQNNTSAQSFYEDHGDVTYQTFYDELSPYGRWIDYPEYGYVWVPDDGRDFRPYSTNGHWIWTDDYEWMWVSDYDWGWAPFHYGRWLEDEFYGWVWVPGYEWSPAWVAWRNGGDYYGWAPLRPGIQISLNFNIGTYNPPYDYWCFVPRRYIASPRIHNYYLDRGRNVTIINQTTIINNYNYNNNVFRTGPRRSEAERYSGRITPVRFRTTNTPGRTRFRNNEVSVYHPAVRQDNNRQSAPRKFDRFERNGNTVANNNGRMNGSNNGNSINRNGNSNPHTNNLPQRNTGVNKRNSPDRQPQNNNTGNDNQNKRQVDRNVGNRQTNRTNESRIPRTIDRQDRTPTQNRANNNRKVFERKNTNGNTNIPSRQPQTRPVERQPVQQPQREQRRQPVQRPQTEQRRPVQQQPQRSEQPRRIERKTNDNNNRSNGNGSGGSKRG